jgi:hypothetical protein
MRAARGTGRRIGIERSRLRLIALRAVLPEFADRFAIDLGGLAAGAALRGLAREAELADLGEDLGRRRARARCGAFRPSGDLGLEPAGGIVADAGGVAGARTGAEAVGGNRGLLGQHRFTLLVAALATAMNASRGGAFT